MKLIRFLLLAAALVLPGVLPGGLKAQTFQSLGSASLSVTTSSGRVILPAGTFGTNITIINVGTSEAFINFGGSTVTAATSNDSVPAGSGRCFSVSSQTYVAAITAAGTATLRINQGTGPCALSYRGGGTAADITVGTTTITGGGNGRLLFDNSGLLGAATGWTTNGTTALTGGASTTLAVGNCTIGTHALCATGTALFNGAVTNAAAGALSASAYFMTGAPITGGTGTTTFPLTLLQPSGATGATGWSTSGTFLGVNAASGFAGNFLALHVNGAASVFSITSNGTVSGRVYNAATSGSAYAVNNDVFWTRAAAATWQQGASDVDAVIIAQTFRSQGALTGGTSNVAGQNWTFIASPGKGTGAGGSFIFQTAPAGGSGTTPNAPVTALTIASTGASTFGDNSGTIGKVTIGIGLTQGLFFGNRGSIGANSDGVFTMRDNATTSFDRLQLGGTTSAFGAINRAGAGIRISAADGTTAGPLTISGSALTVTASALGMGTMTASASAPGAAGGKLELVCGTNAGTAKLVIYAGTSTTAVTVVDNIGTGVSGC